MSTTACNAVSVSRYRPTLAARATVLAAVLFGEKALLNFFFVDSERAQAATGFGSGVWITQHLGFRLLISLAVSLALLIYLSHDERLTQANAAARDSRLRLGGFLAHGVLILSLAPLVLFLYDERRRLLPFAVQAILCLLLAIAAVLALLAALAEWALWCEAARAIGIRWLYALAAAGAAIFAIHGTQMLWAPTAHITFELVRLVLAAFLPNLHAEPTTHVLSTGRFAVEVSYVCSGLEGVGLMLAFCCVWLLYFRKDYHFPRALVLIPLGVLVIFGLNVLRIAALVLIGHCGYPEVAAYGFHSEAGWIAFNAAAGGIAFMSRRNTWLNRVAERESSHAAHNPTAAYLLPFLAILAAGMVSRAASSGFETLYSLRLVSGVLILIAYRRTLATLDWRMSWRGPSAGVATFVVWLIGAHYLLHASSPPGPLSALDHRLQLLWILGRSLTSVIVIPIAEELAYRGYLLRRLAASEFESVRFTAMGLWPLALSSVLFGLGHGPMWLPGVASGLVYGALLIRTGRIGEAVAAHATTNALLAGSVIVLNRWELW